jgi:hypothetical protein
MDDKEAAPLAPGDTQEFMERGLKCSLWGRDAKDMSRDELLAFIGFLADHVEYLMLKISEAPANG